jgi:hypothetical protein
MANQPEKFINLSDIVGLHLRCTNRECGTTLSLSVSELDDIQRDQPLEKCPNCGADWVRLGDDGAERNPDRFTKTFSTQ